MNYVINPTLEIIKRSPSYNNNKKEEKKKQLEYPFTLIQLRRWVVFCHHGLAIRDQLLPAPETA